MEQKKIVPFREKSDAVDRSLSLLKELLKDCPTPTDEDMQKLLGLQAAVLNSLGLNLLGSSSNEVGKLDRNKVQLGIKALAESRMAAEAASRVGKK